MSGEAHGGGAEGGGEKHAHPIIIKKVKGHAHAHHGGAWKVAYADFVTAMMAFFLVMWLVSQSDEVKQNIAGYFNDPIAFGQAGGISILEGGAPKAGQDTASDTDAPAIVYDKEAVLKAQLEQEAKQIMSALDQMPDLKEIMDQVQVEATAEGLRIQLMETEESQFFDVGGAHLSKSGKDMMAAIGNVIGPLGRDVAIEGHTDSQKYSADAEYTNWELSADRANAARVLLQQNGVPPDKVKEIRGYADTRLKYPDRPEDPNNRRISIMVLNPNRPNTQSAIPFDESAASRLAAGEQGEPTGSGSQVASHESGAHGDETHSAGSETGGQEVSHGSPASGPPAEDAAHEATPSAQDAAGREEGAAEESSSGDEFWGDEE